MGWVQAKSGLNDILDKPYLPKSTSLGSEQSVTDAGTGRNQTT